MTRDSYACQNNGRPSAVDAISGKRLRPGPCVLLHRRDSTAAHHLQPFATNGCTEKERS
jgi:hypothetical protein